MTTPKYTAAVKPDLEARKAGKLARLRNHSESLRATATNARDKQNADDMLWVLEQYDALAAKGPGA